MSYLDNGVVRLGVDLNLGGAITYLSPAGTNRELNVINSHDWGRQVQLSFYSGPVPFKPPGARVQKTWAGLGWNPIQSGDCFGHESRVLVHTNDGRMIYVKCVPMQWPLENVPGDCEFEVWLSLEGPVVKARCRLTNHRDDKTWYDGRGQELPAVYVNAPFHRLMTYTGDKPFTGGALTRIEKPFTMSDPWAHWMATESWAAQVNDSGWGLGVWHPGVYDFVGGFYGQPGEGGPKDAPTGYISPSRPEILDHNIVYDYRYELVLGTLGEIRRYIYDHSSAPQPPVFRFERDRQGWHYRHARDTGWPIRGELDVGLEPDKPQLISPVFLVRAEQAPRLVLEAAFAAGGTNAAVSWRRLDQAGFPAGQSLSFPVVSDGKFRRYSVDLSASEAYRGTIMQLRLEPEPAGRPGGRVRLRSVKLSQ